LLLLVLLLLLLLACVVIKLLGTCWSDTIDALVFELLPGGNLLSRIACMEQHEQEPPSQQPKQHQQQQQQQQFLKAQEHKADKHEKHGKHQQQLQQLGPVQAAASPQQQQQQQQQVPVQAAASPQQQQQQTKHDQLLKQQQDKQLPWQQRLLISYQLASALAALHSSKPRQLLHRCEGDCARSCGGGGVMLNVPVQML
jgi:hypothetical protein